MPKQALTGIKILDLTHYVAGPYCTRMLGDFGAEVIKVERPKGGDPARRLGPFHRDHPHPEKSALFLHLNANKLGVTLNLKSSTGVRIVKELAKDVDLVVENFRPGVMDRLGLSYEVLRDINPDLIMTSISNFGQSGPYKGFKASELVLFGMGGPMHPTGTPVEGPVKLGNNMVQYQAGAVAALLTMIGLYGQGRGNCPSHIDVSIMETQAGTADRWLMMLVGYAYTGHVNRRMEPGPGWDVGIHPCKDGYVNLLNPSSSMRFDRFLDLIGKPELAEDPRFATQEERLKLENASILEAYLLEWALDRTMAEIFAEAQSKKMISGPAYTPEDLVKDPHFHARAAWVTTEHPYTGPVTGPGRPMVMSETPWQLRRPAPLLGQHNNEVYCGRLGYSRRDLELLRQMEEV